MIPPEKSPPSLLKTHIDAYGQCYRFDRLDNFELVILRQWDCKDYPHVLCSTTTRNTLEFFYLAWTWRVPTECWVVGTVLHGPKSLRIYVFKIQPNKPNCCCHIWDLNQTCNLPLTYLSIPNLAWNLILGCGMGSKHLFRSGLDLVLLLWDLARFGFSYLLYLI